VAVAVTVVMVNLSWGVDRPSTI